MKIGIDLGGTNIRVGLVDQERLVSKQTAPCPKGEEKEVLEQILTLIKKVMSEEVTSIGVGVPSVVDRERGIVYNVANIPSWKEVHLRQILEDEFHRPAFINNDANCFTLGEHFFGEGKNYKDFVGLTIGTGIGTGLILNGKLYNGHNTGAGEIGSLPFKGKDYEHFCASRFFHAYQTTGKELGEKARENDGQALKTWCLSGDNLGCLMEAILYAYDPQAILLGGGITEAFPYFKDAMYQRLKEFPYQESVAKLHIAPSTLKDAALLGAAMLDE
jgi:glucokinase